MRQNMSAESKKYCDQMIEDTVRVLNGYASACDCLGQYIEATHIYDAISIIEQLQQKLQRAEIENENLHFAYLHSHSHWE